MKKLSQRAQYYIAVLLVPLATDFLACVLLRAENYQPNMPVAIRVGAPILLYVVTVAWLLTHLRRPRGR